MVSALVGSGQLSLAAWEPYVSSRAQSAQSSERRWQRFMSNARIRVRSLYLPLVMVALQGWQSHRLYLALDTTMLWERYCMIHSSGSLLRTSRAVVVARARTRQCYSCVR